MTSFSPVHTVGNQIIEAIQLHMGVSEARGARASAIETLRQVGIPQARAAHRRVRLPTDRRPAPARHDRHGALVRSTAAIADEPTTALDVTTQAQILDLLRELQEQTRHGDHADHAQSGRGRRDVR